MSRSAIFFISDEIFGSSMYVPLNRLLCLKLAPSFKVIPVRDSLGRLGLNDATIFSYIAPDRSVVLSLITIGSVKSPLIS